ncbi:MAG: glutamate racemase [Nitrosomonadales bacterium]
MQTELTPAGQHIIGVFDSGVGGLSVLRHIRKALPNERLIYVADAGHVPYGEKSAVYIEQRSLNLTRFLIGQGADAIVIACNTATAAAAGTLRGHFGLPIVAMEPAVKPAVAATKSGVIGVLATVGTLESVRFAALLERYAGEVEIVTQGCPGLVEQVEQGELAGMQTRVLIERYTAPLLARGADTLILGCTHFSFLVPLISDVVGAGIVMVDTGAAVARQLRKRIQMELPVFTDFDGTAFAEEKKGLAQFWTSGNATQASGIISALWGEPVDVRQLPMEFA